jgi:hypothetical protein
MRLSESGRRRAIREGRRNVHAVIRGVIIDAPTGVKFAISRIRYNPYTTPTFINVSTNEAVLSAARVSFSVDGTAWILA